MTSTKGRIALLTIESLEGYVVDDELAVEPLRALGWTVEEIPWRDDRDWAVYTAVIVRMTWDYQQALDEFVAKLRHINKVARRLDNPLAMMEWNIRKSYLLDLRDAGIPIIPTVMGSALTREELGNLFQQLGSNEIVIKPEVGAGAVGAWRLTPETVANSAAAIEEFYTTRRFLAQPFLSSVLTEGEVSLMYFNGILSHATIKRPAQGDFRVQEEHGGNTHLHPASEEQIKIAEDVLTYLTNRFTKPLYARIDMARTTEGHWALMEVELIEPSLYLRFDLASGERFARAIDTALLAP